MAKLAIAHQAEGMTVQRLEQKSAEKSGSSMDEWRKAVLTKLQAGDKSMQSAGKFLSDRNWTGADATKPADTSAFSQLIGAQGYSSAKNGLPSSLGMMKHLGNDLIYDTGWQPKTSVSYVTRYTAADKKAGIIPKGKGIGDSKTESFVDPEKEPGIVARGGVDAGLGSFVRVGDASNPLRYARVIDAKPGGSAAAEINIETGQNLGDTNFDPNTASGTTNVDVVSKNPSNLTGGLEMPEGARLGNEQTQYAGWLAENKGEAYGNISSQSSLNATMDKYKDDPAFKKYQTDVKAALEKQKKALEKARQDAIDAHMKKTGGDRVERGVPGVVAGKEQRQVVTVTSPTLSGDALKEGRFGTYAGVEQYPVSTLGSLTLEGQAVVTALDDVQVFGAPTSAPAGKTS
jgi:hypothetical protein